MGLGRHGFYEGYLGSSGYLTEGFHRSSVDQRMRRHRTENRRSCFLLAAFRQAKSDSGARRVGACAPLLRPIDWPPSACQRHPLTRSSPIDPLSCVSRLQLSQPYATAYPAPSINAPQASSPPPHWRNGSPRNATTDLPRQCCRTTNTALCTIDVLQRPRNVPL